MFEELRKCNSIGDVDSVYVLARTIIGSSETDFDAVFSMCKLNPSINVKPKVCVLFFSEIGLLDINQGVITPKRTWIEIINKDNHEFIHRVAKLTLNYLIDNELLNVDCIGFDSSNSKCIIKKAAFTLSVAAFRNFLIDSGMLIEETSVYCLSDEYEQFFEDVIKYQKSAFTIEQLKEKLKNQEEQGRIAEEYVVSFEQKQLSDHPMAKRIKRISDFDVSAGFDVVSFLSISSDHYDKFIEVKSFHSRVHFYWSYNEYEQAKIKGERYYLYLVDVDRIKDDSYEPLIICNPANEIMQDSRWVVKTSSYEISMI